MGESHWGRENFFISLSISLFISLFALGDKYVVEARALKENIVAFNSVLAKTKAQQQKEVVEEFLKSHPHDIALDADSVKVYVSKVAYKH